VRDGPSIHLKPYSGYQEQLALQDKADNQAGLVSLIEDNVQ